MSQAYSAITQLFYQLSLIFFWPVAIALLVLFAVAIMDLGALFYESWKRRRQPRSNLVEASARLAAAFDNGHAAPAHPGELSPALRRSLSLRRDLSWPGLKFTRIIPFARN